MADGQTLLDERSGVIYHLNESGAVALSALLAGGDAVAALCARYAVTAPSARLDVTRLLDTLISHGLVVTS